MIPLFFVTPFLPSSIIPSFLVLLTLSLFIVLRSSLPPFLPSSFLALTLPYVHFIFLFTLPPFCLTWRQLCPPSFLGFFTFLHFHLLWLPYLLTRCLSYFLPSLASLLPYLVSLLLYFLPSFFPIWQSSFFPPTYLPSFLPSFLLSSYLPSFLPSFLPTFLYFLPPFLPSFLPSFLLSFLSSFIPCLSPHHHIFFNFITVSQQHLWMKMTIQQIGRASCRERVLLWV